MRFIESICFSNREYQNLNLHQDRVNNTCFHFFGESLHHLEEVLPLIEDDRKHKVRFIYDNTDYECEPLPYVKLPIRSMQVIETSWFDYSFKYEDRTVIQELVQSTETDDILISIDGLITDCSYANLAFWNGKKWLTPEKPLLEGIKRHHLLEEGKIEKASIHKDELDAFEKVTLINAMLDPGDLEISIDQILKS